MPAVARLANGDLLSRRPGPVIDRVPMMVDAIVHKSQWAYVFSLCTRCSCPLCKPVMVLALMMSQGKALVDKALATIEKALRLLLKVGQACFGVAYTVQAKCSVERNVSVQNP